MLRRIARSWLGPLVRWASQGHEARLTNVFDGAAYVVWVDAFGVYHEMEFPPELAQQFADDLIHNAWDRARVFPRGN